MKLFDCNRLGTKNERTVKYIWVPFDNATTLQRIFTFCGWSENFAVGVINAIYKITLQLCSSDYIARTIMVYLLFSAVGHKLLIKYINFYMGL